MDLQFLFTTYSVGNCVFGTQTIRTIPTLATGRSDTYISIYIYICIYFVAWQQRTECCVCWEYMCCAVYANMYNTEYPYVLILLYFFFCRCYVLLADRRWQQRRVWARVCAQFGMATEWTTENSRRGKVRSAKKKQNVNSLAFSLRIPNISELFIIFK